MMTQVQFRRLIFIMTTQVTKCYTQILHKDFQVVNC